MRAWLCVLALAGCDRVFGIGDPYEDAAPVATGSDAAIDGTDDATPDAPAIKSDGAIEPLPALLARYPFDNSYANAAGTGSALHDACAQFDPSGQFMQAVHLDGNCCVSFTLPAAPAHFTIALWLKAQAADSTFAPLVVLPDSSGSSTRDWSFIGSDAQGVFSFATSYGTQMVGTNAIATSWHHYALTFDGQTFQAYNDGNAGAVDQLSGVMVTYGSDRTVFLGCDGTGSNAGFAGSFDEVQVYDGALTATQVKMLHDAPTLQ